jgi:hypothetical protein
LGASGVPSPSPLTSISNTSQLSSFIAAFVQRLDSGSSLPDVKRALRKSKNYYSSGSADAALIVKCRRAPAEQPCVFDAFDSSAFSSSLLVSDGATTCHCCPSASRPAVEAAAPASEEPLLRLRRSKFLLLLSSQLVGLQQRVFPVQIRILLFVVELVLSLVI